MKHAAASTRSPGRPVRRLALLLGSLLGAVVLLGSSGTAVAQPAGHHAAPSLRGTTTVTTAAGVAGTLIRAGVVPLPAPRTSFGFGLAGLQLTASYGFPIVGGNPDLSGPSGDILHAGGIVFTNFRTRLVVSDFDIDLAAGKVFATRVNGVTARLPLLDLDLATLQVAKKYGTTRLSGISLKLDPTAAGALNATFGLRLPADGSLVFGSAVVTLRS